MGEIRGPATLPFPCRENCAVPAGLVLEDRALPAPRHQWGGLLICPNEGCGLAWEILEVDRDLVTDHLELSEPVEIEKAGPPAPTGDPASDDPTSS